MNTSKGKTYDTFNRPAYSAGWNQIWSPNTIDSPFPYLWCINGLVPILTPAREVLSIIHTLKENFVTFHATNFILGSVPVLHKNFVPHSAPPLVKAKIGMDYDSSPEILK